MAEGVPAMVCSGTVAHSGPTATPAPSSLHHPSPNTYVHAKGSLNPGFSLRSRGPAEAASPRNWLQMQIPRPHPRPAESETLRVGLETLVLRGPPAASGARLSLRSSALHMGLPLCGVGGQTFAWAAAHHKSEQLWLYSQRDPAWRSGPRTTTKQRAVTSSKPFPSSDFSPLEDEDAKCSRLETQVPMQ